MTIFDASRCATWTDGVPLIVLAGKEYGSGSSRDWAAKGPRLLGIRAVIAESYERIHRSNLVGMGILPLQFKDGDIGAVARPDGHETFTIAGLAGAEEIPREVVVRADDKRVRRSRSGSTRRRSSGTSATAASSSSCCGSWHRSGRRNG